MDIRRHCQFLLDKEKGKPDAKLRYRIKWDGNRRIVAFSVGYRVDVDKWSADAQRCKANTTHGKRKVMASVINRQISRLEEAVDSTFRVFENADCLPTEHELKEEVNRRMGRLQFDRNKTLFDRMDEFISETGRLNDWTDNTYKAFSVIRNHLHDFDSRLTFDKLDKEGLMSFVDYLRDERHLRNVTAEKQLAFVKWFLRWATAKGYNRQNAYLTFSPKFKKAEKKIIFLDWDELMTVYNFIIPPDGTEVTLCTADGQEYKKTVENAGTLETVRDVFCFCCFTSLRYSDVANLKKSDVHDGYISITTVKTADSITIETNRYSKAILDKYRDSAFRKGLALPVISNQKMNGYLKTLCELCGINQPVTETYYKGNRRIDETRPKFSFIGTHAGRRTFICNALMMGIPPEIVMKWTGHCDYKSMKPYIDITDRAKAEAMSMFDRKSPFVPIKGTKKRDCL